MTSRGPLTWIGEAREKKILEIFDQHIKKIVETVVSMDKAVQAFCNLDIKRAGEGFQEAFKSEREADVFKRKILEELSKGIFHPINRDEIIRLTMTADEIAANAKAVAKKLSYIDPQRLHMELRQIMKSFSTELVKISNRTYDAFTALMKDPNSAIAISQEVERLEENIDDFRAEQLIPETLVWYRHIEDVGLALLLKEITDNMENVADICEDVSDIIRSIAISYR